MMTYPNRNVVGAVYDKRVVEIVQWRADVHYSEEVPECISQEEGGAVTAETFVVNKENGPLQNGLSDQDREILDFERQWWKYASAKEQAIRELFDMTTTRYYQSLNSLIDTEAALAHDPMLVKRLRRMRTSRQQARSSARRSG